MFLVGIPLLIIPFAIYNMIAFLTPIPWGQVVLEVPMASGTRWPITSQDILITFALLLLFIEIFKASRSSSSRGIIDHMLSMGLFVVMLVEFLLLPQAATSVFFLLMMISLLDVLGGFTITARAARRDVAIEEAVLPADRG